VKERRKHPLTLESLDQDVARKQAVIAAHRAMDRSRGSTTDELGRSDSSASKSSTRNQRPQSTISGSPAAQLVRQQSLLQATKPDLVTSHPLPNDPTISRGGPPAYVQAAIVPDFGQAFDGEPSSFRRLRKAKSVLHPSRG